jgi:L-amino acid N-acyltransferase YncA
MSKAKSKTPAPAPSLTGIGVRPCFQQDVQWVQLIYAHHVMTSTGTFETEPPDLEEMTARWTKVAGKGWPFIVACTPKDPTRVIGFAYAQHFRDRQAYRYTFENSVYVAPTHQGMGIGKALMAVLLAELQTIGAKQVLAVIGDSQNQASIRMHAASGFQAVGKLHAVGHKFGRWLDVVLMQIQLPDPPPANNG